MINNNSPLYAVCAGCGKCWNVSIYQEIPKDGYICPHCISRMRKRRKLVKYLLLTIAGIALYKWGAGAAYIERGYRAIGGEYLLLLLPLWYYIISHTVNDFAREVKNNIKGGQNGKKV